MTSDAPQDPSRDGDERPIADASASAATLPPQHYFINAQLVAQARDEKAIIVHPHTQRTGGNTLRTKVLAPNLGNGRIYNQFNVANAKKWSDLTDDDVAGYRAFTDHFDFTPNRLTRLCLPIALLRDPVERAVSLYHYIKGKNGHLHQALAQSSSLEEFYRQASNLSPRYFRNLQCRRICGSSRASVALETILRSYVAVGFTGELNAFADGLSSALGWAAPDLSARRLSPPSDVSPRFRTMVLEENAEDLALFEAMQKGAPYALARRSAAEALGSVAQRLRSDARSLLHRLH